jgi:hypothetical protein
MATVHRSEAEVARDLQAALAKVQQGVGSRRDTFEPPTRE